MGYQRILIFFSRLKKNYTMGNLTKAAEFLQLGFLTVTEILHPLFIYDQLTILLGSIYCIKVILFVHFTYFHIFRVSF